MNPFRTSQKIQAIRPQNPYDSNLACGVCLQNIYDYSPFGVSLDGRTIEGDFYRCGFNGMEKDDEFKGKGNSYTTEFRQLDPRLGRWMTIDPLIARFPWQSSYTTFDNNPILLIDPAGLASETNDGEPEKEEPILGSKNEREVTVLTKPSPKSRIQKIWNRVWGGVNAFFGAMEASIGSGLIATGIGVPLGVIMLLHGADNAVAGISQMASGKRTDSFTYNGVKEVAKAGGANEQIAENIATFTDASISMVGVGLASIVTRSCAKAAPKLAVEASEGLTNGLGKTISVQKQARHLAGTTKPGGGFLNSKEDAQAVLDAVHSGNATFLGTSKTGYQIYRFNGVTGTNVNLGVGITGQPTNVFLIKGTTSPSVVPTSPLR
jgi:RHS repeat-associated protein